MNKSKIAILVLISLCIGILIGGYLFSHSQPRSLLAISQCQSCLTHQDLLGLLASVGIQNFSGLMPLKICETDKTIAIKYPFSSNRLHYVIVPKRDIKNIGQVSEANEKYLTDAFLVARWIIEKENLSRYSFCTNGPGLQDVTYLHFHLIADTGQPANLTKRPCR
jgi:diadenosine tetraphosphate (Ap4A) HIT family hydrolase